MARQKQTARNCSEKQMKEDARALRRSRRGVAPEKAKELAEIADIENFVQGNLDTTITEEQVAEVDDSENEEEIVTPVVTAKKTKKKTAKEKEEEELARLVIELIKVRIKFEEEKDQIYRENEFEKYHPSVQDLDDFDEVPKCPTTTVALKRTAGRRGPTPCTKPTCSYCIMEFKSKYEEYRKFTKKVCVL